MGNNKKPERQPQTMNGDRIKRRAFRLSRARLEELVEEATVDCYNESEQATGLFTMMEDNLELPFETKILGLPVTVEGIDIGDCDQIVACCARGQERQRVPVLELPLPSPPPAGAEWIEAYRYWARGR